MSEWISGPGLPWRRRLFGAELAPQPMRTPLKACGKHVLQRVIVGAAGVAPSRVI